MDFTLLDNPIWNSLGADHAHLAVSSAGGRARRYPQEIGPLSGLYEPTPAAFDELASIVPHGDFAALFLETKSEIPDGWELLRDGVLVQMVCEKIVAGPAINDAVVALEPIDWPEMIALVTLTEPGPFRQQTATLGGFVGIRVDGRLAAMAGRRLSPAGFVEVSAVCMHPDFRGLGYARALVSAVAQAIVEEGRTPFLTSFETNVGAVSVYEQAGFKVRRQLQLAVLKPPVSVYRG